MTKLIEGAKAKIWSISNQIASGKPAPDLKIGLVAFRDKGDAYITKVFDLTDDLDAVHANLRGFKAEGGGDIPESVNQALYDSVHKIKWSTDKKTLRIIFLVGDAPPHMDYTDDVKYPETCKKACEKGIVINTIQCGNDADCTKHWKEICKRAEGTFVQVEQSGGVAPVVKTPYDKRLSEINGEMAKKTVVYGSARRQAESRKKAGGAGGLAPAAGADRAAYLAKTKQAAAYDLVDAIKKGKVKLENLKDEELPSEMKKMTAKERKEYLDKVEKERDKLRKEALDLDKKRSDYIAKKQKEAGGKEKSGFDRQVLDMLRKQAKKYDIKY
jgi:Mg-chelatase subunit ChlD